MNCKNFDTLMNMRKHTILEVMDLALDYMQQYNGRSKTECIAEAISIVKGEKP